MASPWANVAEERLDSTAGDLTLITIQRSGMIDTPGSVLPHFTCPAKREGLKLPNRHNIRQHKCQQPCASPSHKNLQPGSRFRHTKVKGYHLTATFMCLRQRSRGKTRRTPFYTLLRTKTISPQKYEQLFTVLSLQTCPSIKRPVNAQ